MNGDMDIVFFDAGETLVHPMPSFPELFAACCADFGLEVDLARLSMASRSLMDEVEGKQRQGYTFTHDHDASRIFWLRFYRNLVTEIGYRDNHEELPERLYEAFSLPSNYGPYQDALETLRALSARGMRIGLISNFEAWLQDLLDGLGLSGYFEIMVISGNEGVEKPNLEIYDRALKRAGVESGRALHVGDSPVSDFKGAMEAGMKAVLLDRWGRFPDFQGTKITNLNEIIDFLPSK